MGDSGSNHSSAWHGSGSRVNPGHLVYQQSGEDEPSSSIPSSSSSSGDYVSVSSASFVPSSYRGPGGFSNTERYPADSYDVQVLSGVHEDPQFQCDHGVGLYLLTRGCGVTSFLTRFLFFKILLVIVVA